MSNPELTPAEWKNIIKWHPTFRSDALNKFLAKNKAVIEAWIDGEQIELMMGKLPDVRWYGVRKDKLSMNLNHEYRIPPQVTITAKLSVKQANALYRVMEESTFSTDGSQSARNSIMRSIETELRKAGY
ncbi:MAG: hypothetical protein ACRCTP_02285 [Aeromonas popoffii]|uniref:hypothetical protein n=1 Tax=Aeromonas popoffii TaxID=70856 RepID=UPI003F3401E3